MRLTTFDRITVLVLALEAPGRSRLASVIIEISLRRNEIPNR
jgi:hypothetical protein